MARILLIPSDHSGGSGHVTRTMALAEILSQTGNTSAVILEKSYRFHIKQNKIKSYYLNTANERFLKFQLTPPFYSTIYKKSHRSQVPVFMEFDGLGYQIPRDHYLNHRIVNSRLSQIEQIISVFKPDVLIGDGHFLTYITAKKLSIPVIQITRLAGFAPAPNMIWWKSSPVALRIPDASKPFNHLLSEQIHYPEQLLSGDRYLIPSIQQLEPVDKKSNEVMYCGYLGESKNLDRMDGLFRDKSKKKIYITIGGGSHRNNAQTIVNSICKALDPGEYEVLISGGGRDLGLAELKNNVKFVKWLDGPQAIAQSDLVISHGGFGTMMETLLLGKPAIIIPFHTEQEGNGRRLEKEGLGKTLMPVSQESEIAQFGWPFGRYSMNFHFHYNDFSEFLFPMVESLLTDAQIKRNLESVKYEINSTKENFDFEKLVSF